MRFLLLMLLSFPVHATVTITLSADESFEVYLTDDPRNRTGLIGSGAGEGNVYTFSGEVAPYLVIVGHDTDQDSQYGGILAVATITDPMVVFGNGHQTTLTDSHWRTFPGPIPTGKQNNPGSPRYQPAISSDAFWIWNNNPSNAVVFTPIFAVPELSTFWWLLLTPLIRFARTYG